MNALMRVPSAPHSGISRMSNVLAHQEFEPQVHAPGVFQALLRPVIVTPAKQAKQTHRHTAGAITVNEDAAELAGSQCKLTGRSSENMHLMAQPRQDLRVISGIGADPPKTSFRGILEGEQSDLHGKDIA